MLSRSLLLSAVSLAACAGVGIDDPPAEDPAAALFYSCEEARRFSCVSERPEPFTEYSGPVDGERSLCDGFDVEAYRLTRVRSSEPPVIVRAERRGDSYVQRVLRVGEVEHDEVGPLAPDAWGRIVAVVDSASFWTLPDEPVSGASPWPGDVDTWILEGRRGDRYAVAACESVPDEFSDRVVAVGRALIEATGASRNGSGDVY